MERIPAQRSHAALRVALAFFAALAPGCQSRQFYFFKDEEMTHYRQVAAEIEQPCEPCCHEAPAVTAPISPDTFEKTPLWDLPLQEAIGIAVGNSKIARRLPGVGQPGFLLDNAQSLTTSFDPAIQASGGIGSERGVGVEAALSAFDAQLSASMLWERNERPINTGGIGALIFARNFEQDRANWQGELSKTNATGGKMFVRNNVLYDLNNNPTRGVPSEWDVNYEVGFTQPLLQGAGVKFNRIAGPQTNGRTTSLSGGVVAARINEDISLTDFEKSIRDMVYDVETAYWDLYVAYRAFDSARAGRDSSLANWRRVKAFQQAKVIGGEALVLAQARSQYYRFLGDMDAAVCLVLRAENRLRYVMGLAASDGRLIRPQDDPQRAKVIFDWDEIHVEAMTRAVELRRQKWVIQRREMELIAARNLLLPRLDAVALYRWLGAGDQLIDPNGTKAPPFPGSDAYTTLTSGDFQEWQLGFNFSMPLGFRLQMATVRNAQLLVAREKARLEGQELELSHALSEAVRNLDCNYLIAQRRLDELYSTQEEVRQFSAIWESGVRTIGRVEVRNTDLIDAITKRAVAETQFYRALAEYNRAISEVHLRKGSLLEFNRVYLAEGPSCEAAYDAARDKAMRRVSAGPLNYVMRMQPGPVSQGQHAQWEQFGVDAAGASGLTPGDAQPTPAEAVPADASPPTKSATPSGPIEKLPSPDEKPQAPTPPSAAAGIGPSPAMFVPGNAPASAPSLGTAHTSRATTNRVRRSWSAW